MSNYIVDGADLTSVANAIRTKGGTSAQLAFPAGFVSAIGDIPTGGGTPSNISVTWHNASSSAIGINNATYHSTYGILPVSSSATSISGGASSSARNCIIQDGGKISVITNVKLTSAKYNGESLPLTAGGSGTTYRAWITLPEGYGSSITIDITR